MVTWKGQKECVRCHSPPSAFFRGQKGVECGNCGKTYRVSG